MRFSVSTPRRELRGARRSWKRMRRSLKRQRGPVAFAACQQRLAALHRAGQRGEVAVCYADEVRFSRRVPVPNAWQPRGQPPIALPAEPGAGGGSVLGFGRPVDPQQAGHHTSSSVLSPLRLQPNYLCWPSLSGRLPAGVPPRWCSVMPPFTRPVGSGRTTPDGRPKADPLVFTPPPIRLS